MATIPTRRESVSPSTAAGFDPFPGRTIRAQAQRDLGSAQSAINLAGQALNVATTLGSQYIKSKQRTEQAEFNAGLETLSTNLQAKFADNPDAEQYQVEFQDGVAGLTQDKKFLGEEAKFVGEARLARDLGTILQRQVTLQKQADLAGLNSQQRVMTAQAQVLDPIASVVEIAKFGALVDAAVEDGIITASDGEKRRHGMQFDVERGIAKLLPTEPAIIGLEAATLLTSGTPEQRSDLKDQVVADFRRDLAVETASQNAALKAEKAERAADNEAAVDRIEVERRNNTFTLASLDREAKFLTGAEQRTYLKDLQSPESSTDSAGSIVSIEGPLAVGDFNATQHALANAIDRGGVTTDTIKYYNRQIRMGRDKIQNDSRKRIHDQFQLIAGAMRGMGPVMQDIQRNALSQFADFVEANPFATQKDLVIEEKAIIDSFNILALDRVTETIGLPRTRSSNVTRDNITISDLNDSYRTLKFLRSEEAITEGSFLNQSEIIKTWMDLDAVRARSDTAPPTGGR